MEDIIIKTAEKICETDFMTYQDYDKELGLTLAEALTVLIAYHIEEDSSIVYDFINELITNNN